MKRVIAFILVLSLCLSLAACGGTGNETNNYTEITQVASQPDDLNAAQSGNQEFVIPAKHNGSDWVFFMELVNSTDDTLTLEAVISTEFTGDQQTGSFSFKGQTLDRLPFAERVLKPGERITWNDMLPMDTPITCMEYRHIFRDSQGQEFQIVYIFVMSGEVPAKAGHAVASEAPAKLPVAFEVDDGLVDSTNDIVIDFYEFLDQKNAEHKAELDKTYSDEFIKANTPDFYDTLDLVSKEEAEKLLNTPRGMSYEITTKEAALKDIDLLFRIFKCYFGAYFYHGGDEFFGTVKEKMIQQIQNGPDTLSLEELAGIISGNLYFVRDRHMHIGDKTVCDYNYVSLYDFCVKDLYFYQDDIGYYTRINERKWYLQQVGNDTSILDYLQITVDEKGQLCYCILLCEPKNGAHLEISEITLSRGARTATKEIEWSMFETRDSRMINETTTVKNNIPLLSVGFWVPGTGQDANKAEEQCMRMSRIGRAYFTQDVFIFDFVSGSGGYEMFESIPHASSEFIAYRLSQLAEDLGMWNRPWNGHPIGPYYIPLHETTGKGQYATYYKPGLWGENDTIAFTVQDKTNFSASEWHILEARTIENVLTIGGSTGGTSDNGAGHNMVLYNTGLGIELADSLGNGGTGELNDLCIKPDIWCEPDEAAEAAYRICEFYGIKNTADTSALAQYNYVEQYNYSE